MIDALDFLPSHENKLFSKAIDREDRLHEIQLLSDLKYLNTTDFINQNVTPLKFNNAVEKFRKEYIQLLKENKNCSNFSEIYNQFDTNSSFETNYLTEKEIFLLEALCNLEGQFEIYKVPVGVNTLVSRVCLYRYKVYGIAKTIQVNRVINNQIISVLNSRISNLGFDGTWIEFANILGDQLKITSFSKKLYEDKDSKFNPVIFFKVKPKDTKQFRRSNFVIANKKRFKEKLYSDIYTPEIETIIDKKTKANNDIILKIKTDKNQFWLRVIQVKLWVSGLYEGRLDNDFGTYTYYALKEFLEFYLNDKKRPKKEIARVLLVLKSNYGLFNLRYFFNTHLDEIENMPLKKEHSSISNLYHFVTEDTIANQENNPKKKRRILSNQNKLRSQLKVNLKGFATNGIALKQRKQYKGNKRFLRFFSKVFDLIKEGVHLVVRIIKKLLRIIVKSIKIIFYEISRGVRAFREGLQFLFSKRILETKNVISDFDFDFDGISKITNKTTVAELEAHSTLLEKKTQAIYPALNFTRIVIEWGIKLASATSWVKVLIGIAKLFKDYILRSLKQRQDYLSPAIFFSK